MSTRRHLLFLLPAAILAWSMTRAGAASGGTRGPFTPVIARQKLSYVSVNFQGKEKVLYEFVGEYLRSSDGSELATLGLPSTVKNVDPNSVPIVVPTEGRLRIGREGTTYKLDYKKRVATVVVKQQIPMMPHIYDVKNSDTLGHEKIEGRTCVGFLVMAHGDETGRAWRELKPDILMRLESYFGSKDDLVRVILQRFDVSTKQEPDESFFAIPGNWTIIWSAAPGPSADGIATTPKR